jgi:hypothetical protein
MKTKSLFEYISKSKNMFFAFSSINPNIKLVEPTNKKYERIKIEKNFFSVQKINSKRVIAITNQKSFAHLLTCNWGEIRYLAIITDKKKGNGVCLASSYLDVSKILRKGDTLLIQSYNLRIEAQ